MKIVSWNINGIRTFKDNLTKLLEELEGDIICLQETKVSRCTLDESLAVIPSFNSYFCFPRRQSGYSGVATYCRDPCRPTSAEEGLSSQYVADHFKKDWVGNSPVFVGFENDEILSLESEGRALLTRHDIKFGDVVKQLVVINVYCPRNDPERPERANYKMKFYQLLQQRAEALVKSGHHVVIAGDVNTSHHPIDSCDPGDFEEFSSSPYRQWLNSFLINDPNHSPDSEGMASFMDTFRYFHPQQTEAFTCWMTQIGARKTNYGSRIDYIFADTDLLPHLLSADILSNVEGSDHCPISVTIECEPVASKKCPSICTKYWPEFAGKQQSLTAFLRVRNRNEESESKWLAKRQKQCPQQKSIKSFFQPKNGASKDETNKAPGININSEADSVTKNCASKVETNKTFETEVNRELASDVSSMAGKSSVVNGESLSETEHCVASSNVKEQNSVKSSWKALLKGPPKPPKCSGHEEPCVLRIVKKEGPNYGRQFFVCCRAQGLSTNPEARCDFFKWVTAPKINRLPK